MTSLEAKTNAEKTANEQISKFEDGGLLNGKRHRNGGMRIEGTNIEVEGGDPISLSSPV